MANPEIPELVRRLISDHLPSVERVEILLLLADSPDSSWSAAELEERIRSTYDSVAKNVGALVSAGLVGAREASPPRYQFAPANPALQAAVSALAGSYRTRRVAIIELIYAERTDPVRSFSDAFNLGRSHGG